MSPKNAINCEDEKIKFGTPVRTACGGVIHYSADTPCILFKGEAVYFCLPVCKEDFDRDPLSSCLAGK
jgi:YHS domain-containing protein